MGGFRADVAGLAFRVLRAFLDRVRHGLRVLIVGMILLGAAASFNLLADLVMAAFFPVLRLAGWPAVARLAAAALFGQARKRGSARGTLCEDHSTVGGEAAFTPSTRHGQTRFGIT
jgi:hypothetical protein